MRGTLRSTLICDAFAVHEGLPDAQRQLCVAYVIRELTVIEEQYPPEGRTDQIRWAPMQPLAQPTPTTCLRVLYQGIAAGRSRRSCFSSAGEHRPGGCATSPAMMTGNLRTTPIAPAD